MILLPIDLLQKQLDELILARSKALIFFEKGDITEEEYNGYVENLTPKIETYRFAIRTLNQYV